MLLLLSGAAMCCKPGCACRAWAMLPLPALHQHTPKLKRTCHLLPPGRYEESSSDSELELPELLPLEATPQPEPVLVVAAAPARRGGRGRAAANGSSANGSR